MEHIAIIGIDGAGKSTQVELLTKALNNYTPGIAASFIGKGDENNCETFEMMEKAGFLSIPQSVKVVGYALDFIHKFNSITQKNEEKSIIVWDRYYYCLMAYFLAMRVDMEETKKLLKFLPEPSTVFLLDIQPEIALTRLKMRGNAFKSKELDIEYSTAVRQEYLKLAEKPNIILVDANKDVIDVHKIILEKLNGRLNNGEEV